MKKSIFLMLVISVLFGLSSCMETKYVTKKATLDKMVDSVKTQIADDGYYPTGFFTELINEMKVLGASFTLQAGYGTALKNDFVTHDTYTFADSLGNTASFSIFYTLDKRKNVEKVGLCGCETSNPQDYDKVCGPINQINWKPNTDAVIVKDPSPVLAAVFGGALITFIILMRINGKG